MDSTVSILDILNRVDSFYATSWNHLLLVGSIAFGLVGVVVPFAIQYYLKQKSILAERNFREHLTSLVATSKTELEAILRADHDAHKSDLASLLAQQKFEIVSTVESLKSEYKNELEKMNRQLKEEIYSAKGSIFHVQGNSNVTQGETLKAIRSYCDAIDNYVKTKSEINLQRCLGSLADTVKKLNKPLIDADKEDIDIRFEASMKVLDSFNENGRYTDRLKDLRSEFKAAKTRSQLVPRTSAPSP